MRRSSTVLVSSMLVFGVVGAPPSTADPGTQDTGDAVFRVRSDDPRGDARGGSQRARTLADIREVYYRAPLRPEGLLIAEATMTRVKELDGAGLLQSFVVRLASPNGRRTWTVSITHRNTGLKVVARTPSGTRVIRPERQVSSQESGAGGQLAFEVSTEWLPVDEVIVRPALTTAGAARDLNGPSYRLDVSGDR